MILAGWIGTVGTTKTPEILVTERQGQFVVTHRFSYASGEPFGGRNVPDAAKEVAGIVFETKTFWKPVVTA